MAEETAPAATDAPKTDQPQAEPGKTFTQADLDRVVSDRLSREREKYADYSDLKQAAERLQEIEEANASEVEKAQRKATKLEQEAAEAKSKLLRYEVAAEKEIPADALDLLTGSTREELEARADRILGLVKSRTETNTPPDFDGGPREPTEDPKTPEEAHNDFMTRLLLGDQT